MQPKPSRLSEVSPREREVLDLLGTHLTHEEIAGRLFLSVRTVESHVASLRRKLDLPDHRTLVRFAVEHRAASGPLGVAAPPAALTSFIGRRTELDGLTRAVESARLVTAVGPGGAGKTRLALAAAAGYSTIWVDLVPVNDAASLATAVADACGAVPTSRQGPVDATIAMLRHSAALLVLDNAEHLVNPVAVLVERLLSGCPKLRVLVTSRARLALAFEQVFRVEGLSVEPDGDAVALFVERARATGAPLLADAELGRVAAICAALDGLALAVELAAVHMPALGLDGVEHALLDQPTLLTAGARHRARHRSMNETLDWSVTLLDARSAACLRRLSVFSAPFDAALVQLTEHNLVALAPRGGQRAYRLLEPIRQYAWARITGSDAEALARHLVWCRQEVAGLLAREIPETGNIADDVRAALARADDGAVERAGAADLARDFALLLYRAGGLDEAQVRFEQAAALSDDPGPAAVDRAHASDVAKCRIDGAEALRIDLAAARLAEAGGEPRAAALALCRVAELLTRFPGMFAAPPDLDPRPMLAHARELAGDDPLVAAAAAVAEAGYAGPDGLPTTETARHALALARAAGAAALESAASDALVASYFGQDIVQAHRLAAARVDQLSGWRDDPAIGLEIKDALHGAAFTALGAGDLTAAATAAETLRRMPILRERRDLADDDALAPAALRGDFDVVFAIAEPYLVGWTDAGRPPAAGRALLPAAAALAYGLSGDSERRAQWLDVLAEFRQVSRDDAWRGTGHGELFEAMMLLHEERPTEAFEVITADGERGLFGLVFAHWTAAVSAEAAVLADRADAADWVQRSADEGRDNPMATAITGRARALLSGKAEGLVVARAAFARCGASYQVERTDQLAARLPT